MPVSLSTASGTLRPGSARRSSVPRTRLASKATAPTSITRSPLGVLYFVVFFTMAAIGFSLLTVLIGIPLLALTLVVAWACASFERDLARWLLRVEIPPMSFPRPPGLAAWRRARAHLGN